MGSEVPRTSSVDEDEMPLAQRLLMLQKKRAAMQAQQNGGLPVPATPFRAESGQTAAEQFAPKPKAEPAPRGLEKPKSGPPAPVKAKPDPGIAVKAKPDPAVPVAAKSAPSLPVKAKPDPSLPVKAKPDPSLPVKAKPDPNLPARPASPSANIPSPASQPAPTAAGKKKVSETKKRAAEKPITETKKRKPNAAPPSDGGLASESNRFDDEEGSDEHRWWESQENDGTVKWTTLHHNGLFFPPPYEPHGVKMRYAGVPIDLEPEAEEVATFFAGIIGTDHYENETFRNNFFEDFQGVLRSINSKHQHLIKDFHKCDFSLILAHLNVQKERKKNATKEEKAKAKEERAKLDETYSWCLLDGRKEKVGNYRIEPPGLFRGRGKHPRTGKLKTRVQPEQVTINISADALIPSPPPGHKWGSIVHDSTVTWLAMWVENINKAQKYVFLAPGSSLKGQSDLRKFETARELNKHVDKIRRVNAEELRDKEMFVRQRATALWLIDRLALRAGNEKGDDEADTVGCCSLRLEHVKLQEPDVVVFDFLGKDSIRYHNEVKVEPIIYKNLGIFMRPPKGPQDPIFDRLNPGLLNKYLTGLMPGLTAKVFRTYNASHTFQQELEKTPTEGSQHDLVLAYNRANRQVAVLCNHQRAVPKTHQQSMDKLTEKIIGIKYERHLVRKALQEELSKKDLQKECPEAVGPEPDLDAATIKRKAAEVAETEKAKGGSPMKRSSSQESLIKKFGTLSARIDAALNQRIDRDENKATALGTSKTNYIDPRITVAWCAKHGVSIEKMFNKSLRDKFKWAMTVDGSWKF